MLIVPETSGDLSFVFVCGRNVPSERVLLGFGFVMGWFLFFLFLLVKGLPSAEAALLG
jgi:hypothetical protein